MYKLLVQHGRQISRTGTRQLQVATTNWTTQQDREQKIDVSKALEGWDEKLRQNEVGDIDFNLKCIVAKVLQRKFVSVIIQLSSKI